MQSITINGTSVFVQFVLYVVHANMNIPLVYSVFDRSEIMVRGFLANTVNGIAMCKTEYGPVAFAAMPDTENYVGRLSLGMEQLCHGIAVSQSVGTQYIVTTRQDLEEDVYSYLMSHFQLPLLKEWVPYLLEEGRRFLETEQVQVVGDDQGRFQNSLAVHAAITQEDLAELITSGLRNGEIKIGKGSQKKLSFKGLDEYFAKYGHTIVDNLRKKLNPLSPLKDRVDEAALLHKRLYPQQCAITNGIVELMRSSGYCIVNCGCGTGKTIMGCASVEAYFYQKYLRMHKDKTIKDAYLDPDAVKYRNIVMCPSHLVDKWKREIEDEIPYARVTIIRGLGELGQLLRKGRERTGKEFYILSKDTGKLSYSFYPQPYQVKQREVHVHICRQCKRMAPFHPKRACSCGSNKWQATDIKYYETGLVCPECGELLYPLGRRIIFGKENPRYTPTLMPADFAKMAETNKECCWCHAKLWMPACEPVQNIFANRKKENHKWARIAHFANKAKKNMKTVWVLKKDIEAYLVENGLRKDEIRYCSIYGPRRFAPATYIKKKLKGYFDFAIFDELHELKGGGTAQGIAMHSLVKASKKHLGLTGTIAGGYANHVFYLLFRLDPAMMISKGFTYGHAGEVKFAGLYGTIESVYEFNALDDTHNVESRGRVIKSPKCRPGISPLIFSEFLMGKAVFLDLSDMSRYLPDYREEVRFIPLEQEIAGEYNRITTELKRLIKKGEGKTILSTYLQFALSYTDKPYSRKLIVSPIDGHLLERPESFDEFVADGKLLNKERYLVDMINGELGENRNIFVFCEYTGDAESNVTNRLKEVIEKNCVLARYRTVILESQSPQASEREAWMHKKAKEGARVFITNPKCIDTGIDLIFFADGVKYNYPTLIFYQLGYNLFTIWQASRRAFRLIQTEECRTYYLASQNTIQVEVIRLIAEKQVATAAIQGGDFSSEGLSAMANGVDSRIRLANAVAGECEDTEDSIQSMFDVLRHKEEEEEDDSYTPMLTFYELVGHNAQTIEDYGEIISIPLPGGKGLETEDLLAFVFGETSRKEPENRIVDLEEGEYRELPQEEKPVADGTLEAMSIEDSMLEVLDMGFGTKGDYKKETKKKKKGLLSGQMDILDLFSA